MRIAMRFDNGLDIGCIALDNGSFSFPEDIRAQIGGSSASNVIFRRQAFGTTSIGDATLFFNHMVVLE